MKKILQLPLLLALLAFVSTACTYEQWEAPTAFADMVTDEPYDLQYPASLPPMLIPPDNPLTVNGVALGRRLFYDPILSLDSSQSCGSCHNQKFGFSDNGLRYSVGVDNIAGDKNAMAIINLGYGSKFFWDGRSPSMEAQALDPIENPIEMHDTWPNVVNKLSNHADYPALFAAAFGTPTITKELAAKAIAQFERTLLSGDSKYDKFRAREPGGEFTNQEFQGMILFFSETGGDCFHCHNEDLMTDNLFHNNGLDSVFEPQNYGLYGVTGDPSDMGKFKTTTLRNIALTAPYMHDGRFATLREVLNHYNTGRKRSPTLDPLLDKPGRVVLTESELDDLEAFLHTLTDTSFINNPAFSNPFE